MAHPSSPPRRPLEVAAFFALLLLVFGAATTSASSLPPDDTPVASIPNEGDVVDGKGATCSNNSSAPSDDDAAKFAPSLTDDDVLVGDSCVDDSEDDVRAVGDVPSSLDVGKNDGTDADAVEDEPPKDERSLNVVPVPRISARTTTLEEFRQKYLSPPGGALPLLITDLRGVDPSDWTRAKLKELCGTAPLIAPHDEDCDVNEDYDLANEDCHSVKVVPSGRHGERKWGGLDTADLGEWNIRTWGDLMDAQDDDERVTFQGKGRGLYLHDASIMETCPWAIDRLPGAPKYFLRNYNLFEDLNDDMDLVRSEVVRKDVEKGDGEDGEKKDNVKDDEDNNEEGNLDDKGDSEDDEDGDENKEEEKEDGEEGVSKAVDKDDDEKDSDDDNKANKTAIDEEGNRAYMLHLSGRKVWRLVSPKDHDRLYSPHPKKDGGDASVYKANLFDPDFDAHPLLDNLTVYEVVAEPGELLFFPEAWPHTVRNLDDTIGVSFNFVDNGNFDVVADCHRNRSTYDDERDEYTISLHEAFFSPLDDPPFPPPAARDTADSEADAEEEIVSDLDAATDFVPFRTFYENQILRTLKDSDSVPSAAKRFVEEKGGVEGGLAEYRDSKNDTVLHTAVNFNVPSVVEYLLGPEVGLDPNIMDACGRTAMYVAERDDSERAAEKEKRKNGDLIELLKKYGGVSNVTEECRMGPEEKSHRSKMKIAEMRARGRENLKRFRAFEKGEEIPRPPSLNVVPIPRISGKDVSVDEFREKHLKPPGGALPLHITNMRGFDPSDWTRDILRELCGDAPLMEDPDGCHIHDEDDAEDEDCHSVRLFAKKPTQEEEEKRKEIEEARDKFRRKMEKDDKKEDEEDEEEDEEEEEEDDDDDEEKPGQEWAGLAAANLHDWGIETWGDLMDKQDQDGTPDGSAGRGLYFHDASIVKMCPQALDVLPGMPKYFLRDYDIFEDLKNLRLTEKDLEDWDDDDEDGFWKKVAKRLHFPSIFIGKGGGSSGSKLHSDTGLTRAFMLHLSGRKRWRMASPNDRHRLYQHHPNKMFGTSESGTYAVNLFDPDFESHPLLDGLTVYEAVAEPGDVVFFPEGWPHSVQNLDDTIAVSVNFVDNGNLKAVTDFNRVDDGEDEYVTRLAGSFFMPMDDPPFPEDAGTDFVPFRNFVKNQVVRAMDTIPSKARGLVEECTKNATTPLGASKNIGEQKDAYGRTPLHSAAEYRFGSLVEYLLDEGRMAVNVMDECGRTALHSVQSGPHADFEMTHVLKSRGGTMNITEECVKKLGWGHRGSFGHHGIRGQGMMNGIKWNGIGQGMSWNSPEAQEMIKERIKASRAESPWANKNMEQVIKELKEKQQAMET